MEVYLDDEPVTVDDARALTLEQLTHEVRSRLTDRHRLITCIRCDGQTVESDALDDRLRQSVGAFGRIEFQSSDLHELVRQALAGAEELIDESDRSRIRAADLLSQGNTTEAMGILRVCFQAWGRVHDSLTKCAQLLGTNLGTIEAAGTDGGEWVTALRDKLRELKEALEVGDHVLVADILRYEFDELAAGWRYVVTRLNEQATGG